MKSVLFVVVFLTWTSTVLIQGRPLASAVEDRALSKIVRTQLDTPHQLHREELQHHDYQRSASDIIQEPPAPSAPPRGANMALGQSQRMLLEPVGDEWLDWYPARDPVVHSFRFGNEGSSISVGEGRRFETLGELLRHPLTPARAPERSGGRQVRVLEETHRASQGGKVRWRRLKKWLGKLA